MAGLPGWARRAEVPFWQQDCKVDKQVLTAQEEQHAMKEQAEDSRRLHWKCSCRARSQAKQT